MRAIQRISAALAIAAVGVVGALLFAEATDLIGSAWRESIADALRSALVDPAYPKWVAALLGIGFGVVALVVAIAQFVPYRRSTRYQYVVDNEADGSTAVSARAVQAAVEHVVADAAGVLSASAILTPAGKVIAQVDVTDDADVLVIDDHARTELAEAFWSRLGMDPRRVDLSYQFRRTRQRVTA